MRMLRFCFLILLAATVCAQSGTRAWYPVLEVKGTATKQTDLFETKGSKWRIRWQKPNAEDHLRIYVYNKDGSLATAIASKNATTDESYVHKPGTYYLAIGASSAYHITVEDWR